MSICLLMSMAMKGNCPLYATVCIFQSQDGDFSEDRFRNIVNATLANDIGNLLNRALNLLRKHHGDTLPLPATDVPATNPLRAAAAQAATAAAGAYAEMRFHNALAAAVAVSSEGNRLFDEVAPWVAFKKVSLLLVSVVF